MEVVRKEPERLRGLQFRKSLCDHCGMLFVFPHSQIYSFWMKDTLIPLDMIWMDYARRVVYIEKNVPPCRADPCPAYTPTEKAVYVLEINAGSADRWGLRVGDTAAFRLDRLE